MMTTAPRIGRKKYSVSKVPGIYLRKGKIKDFFSYGASLLVFGIKMCQELLQKYILNPEN